VNGPVSRLGHFTRTAAGFRDLLRTPPLNNPVALIRERLENRAKSFLDLARRVIFADPANPYYQMLRLAGCAYDDLVEAVNRSGVEATLASLHRNGVYLAHDEFKLKRPIVRSNRQIAADERSFQNPLVRRGVAGSSGGSRSTGTKIRTSTEACLVREAYDRIAIREFGLDHRRLVVLKPILPATDGLLNLARYSRLGCTPDRWFSPIARSVDSAHYRWATYSLVALARAHGVRIPKPLDLPPNDFSPVACWIAERRRQGIRSVVLSYASPAVRVAAAAAELGLPLDGTLFLVGGETLTSAKRRVIESAGAQVFPRYSITEFGAIGHACRQMNSGNSVHLFGDSVAAIVYRRTAPFSDVPVDSLLFTSLSTSAPAVLINAEMDDCGVLTQASCDCAYAELGFTTAVRDISSFGKLTGHGVTLVGTDIVRILEEVLPSRFGGSATDYQLVETDGADQAKLTLRIARRVPLSSVDDVKSCFLRELRAYFGGEIASRLWRDAGAVGVVRDDPIPTGRGKILPLHLLGSGAGDPSTDGS
jgi:hypothetical protein